MSIGPSKTEKEKKGKGEKNKYEKQREREGERKQEADSSGLAMYAKPTLRGCVIFILIKRSVFIKSAPPLTEIQIEA
jgi:hypothetical protein